MLDIHAAVEALHFGSHDETSHTFPWDAIRVDDDATHAWFTTTTVEDAEGVDRTVVVSGNRVIGVLGEGANTEISYHPGHWDAYREDHWVYSTEDDTDEGHLDPAAMDSAEFRALFDYRNLPELAPTSQCWWPCSAVERGEAAAVRLGDLPVCTVTFSNGEAGFALSGGGMDMTWFLARAYVRLGMLPPADLAANLRAVGGRGTSDEDRTVIGAALRVFAHRETEARANAEKLRAEFPDA